MHLKDRIRIIREYIIGKKKESRSNKIKKVAEDIRENVKNRGKNWEVKRRITRRKEVKYLIKMKTIKLHKTNKKL